LFPKVRKVARDSWADDWFVQTEVEMSNGERLTMKRAEMGSWVAVDL